MRSALLLFPFYSCVHWDSEKLTAWCQVTWLNGDEAGLQNLDSSLLCWGSLRPLDLLLLPQGHLSQPFLSLAMWKTPGRQGKIQFEPLVCLLGQRWDAMKKMSGQEITWRFYCPMMLTFPLSEENRLANFALESKILKWKWGFFPFDKNKYALSMAKLEKTETKKKKM